MTLKEIEDKYVWSEWRQFPDPRNKELLSAPFGAGVYQLYNRNTKEYVYCGKGKHTADRMSSLLPSPFGCGTRDNSLLRQYALDNIADLDYRTSACNSITEATNIENELKRLTIHKFNT